MIAEKAVEIIKCRIEQLTESGCWIYTGHINSKGYPRIQVNGRNCGAHRLLYEAVKCHIPIGLQLDHLCRVRCCVNPDHLEAVTSKVNVLRGTGSSAVNATKTHCKYGHVLGGFRLREEGLTRRCRECHNNRAKIYRDAARLQARASRQGQEDTK